MAVLCREVCYMLRRHGRKSRVGHIDEVAVLILAVHAVQPDAVHLLIAPVQILVLAVGVAGIPEIELQRIVIILAEIHQRVHFLAVSGCSATMRPSRSTTQAPLQVMA